MKRVVITGRGAVSPLGLKVGELSEAVRQGRSGIKTMDEWADIKGLHSFLAAPPPDFDPKDHFPRIQRRTMGDMALYAAMAAREAVTEAGFTPEQLSSGRIGVAIGSTTGSPEAYEAFYKLYLPEKSISEIKSGFFFQVMGHSCAANVCLSLGINGEQWAPSSACTSSAQAIGLGYLLIKTGRQDAMLCGGADGIHPTVTMTFDILKAASRRSAPDLKTPRPFDRERDGVVCGGGSGILALESLDSARARGARIFCEISGFGHVCDHHHIANPSHEAMGRAMRACLKDAGAREDEVDYINAHATGTIQGDRAEALAISRVFGSRPGVSSLKGHMGHTLGAACSLEAILVTEMMARREVIPTLHLENPDPECSGINLIQTSGEAELNTVIKNNFALGGVNSALLFRRITG